jgi:hypothetical protein
MFKELLSQIKHRERQVVINLGPVDIKIKDKQALPLLPLEFTEANLRIARKNGVKPLSLEEILAQIKPEEIGKAVLFDTPPVRGFVGNHWRITRITELDRERKYATLQLCGIFGTYDYDQVLPVNVPLNTVMFTGVSIQKFKLNSTPATLKEVVCEVKKARDEGRDPFESSGITYDEHDNGTIFFSDEEGKLTLIQDHPAL